MKTLSLLLKTQLALISNFLVPTFTNVTYNINVSLSISVRILKQTNTMFDIFVIVCCLFVISNNHTNSCYSNKKKQKWHTYAIFNYIFFNNQVNTHCIKRRCRYFNHISCSVSFLFKSWPTLTKRHFYLSKQSVIKTFFFLICPRL